MSRVSDLQELIEVVLPNIISRLRYVTDGDMVFASDFNEVLSFAKSSMEAILIIVEILKDKNIEIPERVIELITEVMDVLW